MCVFVCVFVYAAVPALATRAAVFAFMLYALFACSAVIIIVFAATMLPVFVYVFCMNSVKRIFTERVTHQKTTAGHQQALDNVHQLGFIAQVRIHIAHDNCIEALRGLKRINIFVEQRKRFVRFLLRLF